MKCPHCLESFFEDWIHQTIQTTKTHSWQVSNTVCPSCNEPTVKLSSYKKTGKSDFEKIVHPIGIARAPLHTEVTEKYSKSYKQAAQVLSISPEASAAISRRCLQNLLREEAKVKPRDLVNEIQEVIDSGKLPSTLSESIDAIRNIGNFGSHPIKSTNTGEIVDVEPGEAEWNLDVLEELFDHYLVKPKRIQAKRAALDKKLVEAGKKPMK